jgi:hypothetical protein
MLMQALPNVAQTERAEAARMMLKAKLHMKLCSQQSWRVFHPRWSIGSAQGYPDLTLCRPPRLIFAELKRDDGVCTEAQLAWLEDLGKCFSVEVKLWRPCQWQEIVDTLALPRGSAVP